MLQKVEIVSQHRRTLPPVAIVVAGLCLWGAGCSVLVDTECSEQDNLCPPGSRCLAGDCVEVTDAEISPCAGGLLDSTSGLCWQDPPDEERRNWDEAVSYCETLDLGGHRPGEWHLPTIGELRSLIRGCPGTVTGGACGVTDDCLGSGCQNSQCYECSYLEGPGTDGAYWPAGFGGPVSWYWSSSSYAGYPLAWYVTFGDGNVNYGGRASDIYVRCVRGGP